MDTLLTVIIVVVVIGVVIFIYSRRSGEHSDVEKLRAECYRQLNMPPAQARETLDRYLENLRQKHPGKSEEWYLDKILYDLQRDR